MVLSKTAAGITLPDRMISLGRREGETLNDILDELDKVYVQSPVVDLSGTGSNEVVFFAEQAYTIEEASFIFTEASSADAGCNLTVGKLIIGTDDPDYFVVAVASASSKETAYEQALTLAETDVAAGDVIVFVSAGGKSGEGEGFLNMILKRA